MNVMSKTFTAWQRAGFRRFWCWQSRLVRPQVPPELRALIRELSRDNPGWGEARIAHELLIKLGFQISPRTVRTYMPNGQSIAHLGLRVLGTPYLTPKANRLCERAIGQLRREGLEQRTKFVTGDLVRT